jgi:CIC family chloride channel protein
LLNNLQPNIRLVLDALVKFFKKNLGNKTFLVIASLLVGVLSGLAAVVLKKTVHFFQNEPKILFNNFELQYLLPFTPLIGILISVLIIKFVFKGKFRNFWSFSLFFLPYHIYYFSKCRRKYKKYNWWQV